MNKILSFYVVTLLSLILVATPVLAEKQSKEGWPSLLVLLSGPNGGQWFTLGGFIADLLNNELLPTSDRTGGGVSNLGNVENKTADIAFTLTCFIGAGNSNEKEYEKLKTENVTIIANVYPQVYYLLLRKDFADKYKIKDARGFLALKEPVRFASLKPGTASEFIVSMLLKYGYNTSFDQLEKQGWEIKFINYAETADDFVTGKIDCFAYTAGTNVPLIKEMEEHLEIVILPVEEKVLATMAAKFQTGTYIINKGDYNTATKSIATLGDYTTLIAHKDLPNSLVYEVLNMLFKNKNYIADSIGVIDFASLSTDTAVAKSLPMHPCALKFWNDEKSK